MTNNGNKTLNVFLSREVNPYDSRILIAHPASNITISLTYSELRALSKDLAAMRRLMIRDMDDYKKRTGQCDSLNRALDAEHQPETSHDAMTVDHHKNPDASQADNVDTQASGIDLASALEESNRFAPIVEWTATSHLTTSPERGNE